MYNVPFIYDRGCRIFTFLLLEILTVLLTQFDSRSSVVFLESRGSSHNCLTFKLCAQEQVNSTNLHFYICWKFPVSWKCLRTPHVWISSRTRAKMPTWVETLHLAPWLRLTNVTPANVRVALIDEWRCFFGNKHRSFAAGEWRWMSKFAKRKKMIRSSKEEMWLLFLMKRLPHFKRKTQTVR